LYAALASSRDERTREAGLMRALGATRRQLQWAQLLELGFSGALAGTLAAAAALAVGLVLARQVFQFEYQPQWLGLLGGLVLGAAAAMLAGTFGLRLVLRTPPIQTLRNAA
jgi:putative ABC transport system permease protein